MPKRKRSRAKASNGGLQIDPPVSSASSAPAGPSVLRFAEPHETDLAEWWIQILQGTESWDELPVEQQALLAEWWIAAEKADPTGFAAWLDRRGVGATTTHAVVTTPELPSVAMAIRDAAVPPTAAAGPISSPIVFARDAHGVLQPIEHDTKAAGTAVAFAEPALEEPRRKRVPAGARGPLLAIVAIVALALLGVGVGWAAQGTDPQATPQPISQPISQPTPPRPITTKAVKTATLRAVTGPSCSDDAKRGIPTTGTFEFTFTRDGDQWTMVTQSGAVGRATSADASDVTFVFPLRFNEPAPGFSVGTQMTEVFTFTGRSLTGVNTTRYEFAGSINGVDLTGQTCAATFDVTGSTDLPLDDDSLLTAS